MFRTSSPLPLSSYRSSLQRYGTLLLLGVALTLVAISSFAGLEVTCLGLLGLFLFGLGFYRFEYSLFFLLLLSAGVNYNLMLEYRLELEGVSPKGLPLSLLDLVVFATFLSGFFQLLTSRRRIPPPIPSAFPRPFRWPFLLMVGVLLLSAFWGIAQGNSSYQLLRDLRTLVYFLGSFYLTSHLIGHPRQVKLLAYALVIAGILVALQQVITFFGRLSGFLEISSVRDVGIPTGTIVFASLILFFASLYRLRVLPASFHLPLQGFLGLGILVSFTRSVWAQFLLGYSLSLFYLDLRKRQRAFGLMLVLGFFLVLVLPRFVELFAGNVSVQQLLVERVRSFFRGARDPSQAARLSEASVAFQEWLQSPFLGRGLGYRFYFFDPVEGRTLPSDHIHNSILFYLVKMGILGLLAVSILYWRALRLLVQTAFQRGGEALILAKGLACALISSILLGIWSGNLNWVSSSPVLGSLLGLNWALISQEEGIKGERQ